MQEAILIKQQLDIQKNKTRKHKGNKYLVQQRFHKVNQEEKKILI